MSRSIKVTLLILLVLVLDQWLKVWVKTHMNYEDSIHIFGLKWATLRFVENDGMAFGWTLSFLGDYGKYALSIFRIIAVAFLFSFLGKLIKAKASTGLLLSFALVLAGAIGNILDSAFYGLIFSESPYHGGLATLFPDGGGYSGFLQGKVVDMFYFELSRGYIPAWFPFWKGEEYVFFRPVFNIADAAITTGVLSIILLYRGFFGKSELANTEIITGENLAAKETIDDTGQSAIADDKHQGNEEPPQV